MSTTESSDSDTTACNMTKTFIGNFQINVEPKPKILKLHQKVTGYAPVGIGDASEVLVRYMEKLYESKPLCFHNLNVIELGAGVGCVGITAAVFGANVLVTELPESLKLLKLNIDTNKLQWKHSGGNVEAKPFLWGDKLEVKFTPHHIYLANCVYHKESIDSLVKTLKDLANKETDIFVSQNMLGNNNLEECWEYFKEQVIKSFRLEDEPIFTVPKDPLKNTEFISLKKL